MFFSYLKNYKTFNRICITTLYPERILNALQLNNIIIWNVSFEDNILTFCSLNKDILQIKELGNKFGCNIKLENQAGFIRKFNNLKNKTLLISLLIMFLFAIFILSQHIWNIVITADSYEDAVYQYVYSLGIKQSIKKDSFDTENLGIDILKEFNNFESVDIRIKGTTLYIDAILRDSPTLDYKISQPVNLIASEDGIIDNIEVYNGIGIVKEGDRVRAGDILISGELIEQAYGTDVTVTKDVHAMGKVTIYKEEQLNNLILNLYIPNPEAEYESEFNICIGNNSYAYSECADKTDKVAFYDKNKKLKLLWFEIPVLYDEIKWYNINNCTQKTEYEIAQELNDLVSKNISENDLILDITYSTNITSEHKLEADVLVKYSRNIAVEEIIN